jgi:hypothetical protein
MNALTKLSEMTRQGGASRRRLARSRPAAAAAIMAGTAVLAVACGGGSSSAGSGTSQGQASLQAMAVFAQCMHSHGEPNLYISGAGRNSASPGGVVEVRGYTVAGADPNSPQFAAAMNACAHVLPPSVGTAPLQVPRGELKFAACMRTHGYPTYPDPKVQNGQEWQQLPAGVDPSSPQFQAAQKACGGAPGG